MQNVWRFVVNYIKCVICVYALDNNTFILKVKNLCHCNQKTSCRRRRHGAQIVMDHQFCSEAIGKIMKSKVRSTVIVQNKSQATNAFYVG